MSSLTKLKRCLRNIIHRHVLLILLLAMVSIALFYQGFLTRYKGAFGYMHGDIESKEKIYITDKNKRDMNELFRNHLEPKQSLEKQDNRFRTPLLRNIESVVERYTIDAKAMTTSSSTDDAKEIQPPIAKEDDTTLSSCHVQEKIVKKTLPKHVESEKISCKPHKTPLKACQYTEKVYGIDTKLQFCGNNIQIYCTLIRNNKANAGIKFNCRQNQKCDMYIIYGFQNSNGKMRAFASTKNAQDLEHLVEKLSIAMLKQNTNFIFIKCLQNSNRIVEGTQLVLLPTIIKERDNTHKRAKKPNINIVLLDSLSRSHFYRSLPLVVSMFSDINKDYHSSKAEVIDFQLFQSVHGHSAENLHAFFTGKLLPRNLSDSQKEIANIGIGKLFGNLKDAGYETMYQDDLCWEYWWGMRMEVGNAANWKELKNALARENIDYTGLTFSSCEVLASNKLKTPFQGPDNGKICFNGRFQHYYFLQNIYEFHAERSDFSNTPRISFSTINTPHDYKGTRVQTLNHDLANFVRDVADLQNTLTIILADHGNTYTTYTSTMLEGRFEMYHPSFFMIVPKGVRDWLGEEVMNALRINSNRLFTMIDLHKTISEIGKGTGDRKFSKNQGLLGIIPPERLCKDLDLALPNLCVCEGWDSETKNDTTQIGIVEFAVGILNNRIEQQRRMHLKSGWSGNFQRNCQRLNPISFDNVRERNSGDDLITSLDFTVRSGGGSGQAEDVFHAEILSKIHPDLESRSMQLLSFDRLSQYGIYRKCKDKGVEDKLCVCSLLKGHSKDSQRLWEDTGFNFNHLLFIEPSYKQITSISRLESLTQEKCLYVLTRKFFTENSNGGTEDLYAVSIEVFNICQSETLDVIFKIKSINFKTSTKFPLFVETKPKSVTFIGVLIRSFQFWESSYSLTFTIINENKLPEI